MFLYRLQEKKFYFINFLVICTKNCTDNIKTSKSENYSFSIYNKKSGKKLIFNFGFLLERKDRTTLSDNRAPMTACCKVYKQVAKY